MTVTVHHGDCVEVLASMAADSIDAIVCDPPYGLEFMGREWDRLDGTVLDDPASVGGFQDGAGGNPYSRSRIRYGTGDVRQRGDSTFTEGDRKHGLVRHGGSASYGSDAKASGQGMQAWHERWAVAAYRVLKPGGFLLAFSGTRTYHRLACAIEDAGFEVRDMIDWLYGSGFPKSMDVARAVDNHLGVEGTFGEPKSEAHAGWIARGTMRATADTTEGHPDWRHPWEDDPAKVELAARQYLPGSPEGQAWRGWGTALKPGHEPIVVARKPVQGTVAANVLAYGVGGLNIDASRIESGGGTARPPLSTNQHEGWQRPWNEDPDGRARAAAAREAAHDKRDNLGRYPANVILGHGPGCEQVGWREVPTGTAVTRNLPPEGSSPGHVVIGPPTQQGPDVTYGQGGREEVPDWRCEPGCPVAELDAQSGDVPSTLTGRGLGTVGPNPSGVVSTAGMYGGMGGLGTVYGDAGGASRFFYVAKASTAERNRGLAEFPMRDREDQSSWSALCAECGSRTRPGTPGTCGHPWESFTFVAPPPTRNVHPTVKPVDLMRYLIRMVTPPGGTVLDPFLGSGTTGIAAVLEGVEFVGIEREAEYVAIAEARIEHARLAPRAWEPDAPPPKRTVTKGDGWEQGAML